jgi:hypothetical protein
MQGALVERWKRGARADAVRFTSSVPADPSMPNPGNRFFILLSVLLCACATSTSGPSSESRGTPGFGARQPQAPDPARVYADLLGKTEDLPRVVRSPKEYEGRNVVLYGLRNGDLRPIEGRYSMPLAGADGRPAIAAIERPANNQFYLLVTEDFAREARDRKMLASLRGPVFVECKVTPQTTGRITSYPCEVLSLVLIADNRITDLLSRTRDRTLEYHRF